MDSLDTPRRRRKTNLFSKRKRKETIVWVVGLTLGSVRENKN